MTIVHILDRPGRTPRYVAACVPEDLAASPRDMGRGRMAHVYVGGRPQTIARKIKAYGLGLACRNGQLAGEMFPATIRRANAEHPMMAVADNLLVRAAGHLDANHRSGVANDAAERGLASVVAEAVAAHTIDCRGTTLSCPDVPAEHAGSGFTRTRAMSPSGLAATPSDPVASSPQAEKPQGMEPNRR